MTDFSPYYRLSPRNKFFNVTPPTPHKVIISAEDNANGVILRYFAKMSNSSDAEIFEISKQNYENLKNTNLYRTLQIPWLIRGNLQDEVALRENGVKVTIRIGVKTANQNTVKKAALEFSNIGSVLNNPLQFYIGT